MGRQTGSVADTQTDRQVDTLTDNMANIDLQKNGQKKITK